MLLDIPVLEILGWVYGVFQKCPMMFYTRSLCDDFRIAMDSLTDIIEHNI